jgi:hypothetical protein
VTICPGLVCEPVRGLFNGELTMDEATRRLNEAFRDILLRHEVAMTEARIAAAKADPVKNKKTLQFEGRLSWRFFEGGIDRRGVRRRFAWTTTRNAAGYFLSFVEVYDTKKGRGERKDFGASKTRNLMKERARRMYRAYANRNKSKA